MCKKTISTHEELVQYLKSHVSEKRFVHSIGVAQTTQNILRHFNQKPAVQMFNNFEAAAFCGTVHDLARELTDQEILFQIKSNNVDADCDELEHPVLIHGIVGAMYAKKLCGNYPQSWFDAIVLHTLGNKNMDNLALSLFCADYIEPSRKYMTDSKRAYYLSASSLQVCAYRILCDMIKHWEQTPGHIICKKSLDMKAWLESVTEVGDRL